MSGTLRHKVDKSHVPVVSSPAPYPLQPERCSAHITPEAEMDINLVVGTQ